MWPQDAGRPEPLDAAAHEEGSATQTEMFEPVRHQGEFLGALSVTKKPGDPIHPNEERLIRDLAAQAGLVMRNVALTEQLMRNIDELRASRQRLVTAQDEGRRRIERNLHDGAQQQIVALTVKLRLLGQVVERDAQQAKSMAADLQADANDALEQLRDLARGIYPPLLADQGLVAALQAQARKAAVPTEVRSDGVGRYPQDTEAAVYFCVLEALNNIAKYAGATRADVTFARADGELLFTVVTTEPGSTRRRRATGPASWGWPTGWTPSGVPSGSPRGPERGRRSRAGFRCTSMSTALAEGGLRGFPLRSAAMTTTPEASAGPPGDRHRYYETLVEASPTAIVTCDPSFQVTEWNPAAERLFGWTRAEALGPPYRRSRRPARRDPR